MRKKKKTTTKAKKKTRPETILFNLRLEKAALGEAKKKAKRHFKGNMSALVRAALRAWRPGRGAAA